MEYFFNVKTMINSSKLRALRKQMVFKCKILRACLAISILIFLNGSNNVEAKSSITDFSNSELQSNEYQVRDSNTQLKIETILDLHKKANNPERIGGYAVAIIQEGKVLLKECYGFANEENKIPFKFNSVFNFASIAKQFTGYSIAILCEMNKLSLDDDIRMYLPDLPDFGYKITIRHLLNHTSGLRDWVPLVKLSGRLKRDVITSEYIMTLVKNQKELNFIPGEEFAYCNTGYFLLAHIVESITNMAFDQWMKEYVFSPLQMESSFINMDCNKIIPNLASSYLLDATGEYKRFVSNTTAIGSSDMYSTINDMIKWMMNFDYKKIGGEKVFELMYSPSYLNNGESVPYNFGLQRKELAGHIYYMHGGSWGGYLSELLYLPEEQISYIFISNRSPSGVYLRGKILNLLLDISKESPAPNNTNFNRPFIELNSQVYDKYIGDYAMKLDNPNGNEIYYLSEVFLKQGQLIANSVLYRNNMLYPISTDEFFIRGGNNTYTFYTDDHGYCSHYSIKQDDRKYTFYRMEKEVTNIEGVIELLGEYYSDELNTSYLLSVNDKKLTVSHPVNEDVHLYKVGTDNDDYVGDQWWMNDVVFIRDEEKKVTGFIVQTTGGNLSKNIKFKKVVDK